MTEQTDNPIQVHRIPRMANGYRLQFEEAQDSWVLLYPEGMVKLNGSASHILQRCDGQRNVEDIILDLEKTFETDGLSNDVIGFLSVAREQHWIALD